MSKKVVVVGVGALGSHFVLLARNLPARFTVVDMDRVERKNVLSQFHTTLSVGKNKAVALQQAMSGLFGAKLEAVPHRLTTDNAAAILGDAELVVDCLDNAASRRVVQDLVRARNIPCLHGALAPGGQLGRVLWDADFRIDDEAGMGAATCEDGEHLPFVAAVAAELAAAVQRFLAGQPTWGVQISPRGWLRI